MITPRPFRKGDTVHIISPSAGLMPFIPQRVERAKKHLENIGYKVIMGKFAAGNSGYVSASIDERISDIHDAFRDKSCSLILCSIGGNHSNQLLDKIDYDLIRKNPKAFCGYSDISVLHLAILAKTGLKTYYGPTFLNQFGEYPNVLDFTLDHFKSSVMGVHVDDLSLTSSQYTDEILDWFTGADGTRARSLLPHSGMQIWKEGTTTGSALPFTIPSINHVINTQYMPRVEAPILMIDIPEGATMHDGLSVGEFDAWFSDLLNTNLVKESNGIIIGRAYKYTAEMVDNLKSVILERCASFDIPIVYGADFGHTDPMMSVGYGTKVTIDTTTSTIFQLVA